MSSLPDHILARMAWFTDPANREHPQRVELAAMLSDELREWSNDPAGYVPREVLVEHVREAVEWLEASRGANDQSEVVEAVVDDLKPLLAGQCPAWFVLADWERMTEGEREAAGRWIFGTPEVMQLPIPGMTTEGTFANYAHFVAGTLQARDPVTRNYNARLDWLANELRTAGHVPEGWGLEWVADQDPIAGRVVIDHYHSHGHLELNVPLTFDRVTCNQRQCVYHTEEIRVFIGHCYVCRTVYATRPTVAEPVPEPVA